LVSDWSSDVCSSDLEMPVVPGGRYVPLYEGRMVHQFDCAAKAYVSGEGRSAKWRELPLGEKVLLPHFFVNVTGSAPPLRAGYCSITGQTNERSLLATMLPAGLAAGNKVPTLTTDS